MARRGPLPELKVKLEQKIGIRAKESSFLVFDYGRERGGEGEHISFLLRSSKLRWSDFVEPRCKIQEKFNFSKKW